MINFPGASCGYGQHMVDQTPKFENSLKKRKKGKKKKKKGY